MNNEQLIVGMEEYISKLKELQRLNPELARKEAEKALQRIGYLDKNGNARKMIKYSHVSFSKKRSL